MTFASPSQGAPGKAARGLGSSPVWALGFRPFYLLAAGFAVLWVPLWVLLLLGLVPARPAFDAVSWHGHEMIYGFTAAVLVGFLYTAIPNWTGRPTPKGPALMALALVWLAGRLAMVAGGDLPTWAVAAVDVAFLPLAVLGMAGPLIKTRNRRNALFPVALLALAGGNLLMHLDPATRPAVLQVGLAAVGIILVVMGGRVIPFFTGSALPQAGVRRVKALELAGAWLAIAALALGALLPAATTWPGALLVLAGVASLARQAAWAPLATRRAPILWVLHLGFAWVGVALVLMGLDRLGLGPAGASPAHALTVGAVATLCLGMMARTALGHSGRPIRASGPIVAAFWVLTAAAVLRVFGPAVMPEGYGGFVALAGLLWSLAFALYLWDFVPILTRPRLDGRPG